MKTLSGAIYLKFRLPRLGEPCFHWSGFEIFLIETATMRESISASLRDAFSLSTWLGGAALIQCLVLMLLPLRLAILPSFSLVAYRVTRTLLAWTGIIKDHSIDGVRFGRWTSKWPPLDGQKVVAPADKSVTVLVLGARFHQ